MTSPLHPTTDARRALAARLSLPYSDSMQDWEWEIADSSRLAEFVAVYEREPLNAMEQFSLMEIIVQCAEDLAESPQGASAWSDVERLIYVRPDLHLATVRYWACLEADEPEQAFRVAPKMRELWAAISPSAAKLS